MVVAVAVVVAGFLVPGGATAQEPARGKIASDLKLPKDVANYLIQQAAASKDELFRVVGKELRGFLESVNISGEKPMNHASL